MAKGRIRRAARDLSLLFFGGLAAYLASFLFAARLAIYLMDLAARLSPAPWVRVLMGMAAVDLVKAPAMFVCALPLAHAVSLGPWGVAAGLTAVVYLLDLLLALLLHQAPWLWGQWQVLLLRLASAALLTVMTAYTVRWRRK